MITAVTWGARSRRRRLGLCALLTLAVLIIARHPQSTLAHPLGNFTINRYAQLALGADTVQVVYALDMAEIPTFQEMDTIDRNHDGVVSDAERSTYLSKKLPELAHNLKLVVNGKSLTLRVDAGNLSFTDGQGGLKILRVDATFSAGYPADMPSGAVDAQVRDTIYDDRLGWKEIVVQGTAGAAVVQSSVPATGISDMLRSYPQDALQSPLNVREAHFRFQPGVVGTIAAPNSAAQVAKRTSRAVSPGVLGRFADSVATKHLTPPIVAFLIVAALFWGAVHAVGPGHGKTVVAAYLVGSRGTARHAIMLGTTVTATHTASTYLLGFITLFASHYIVPEKLYPALTLTSGLLVIVMGVFLLVGRLRAAGRWPAVWRPRLGPVSRPALAAVGVSPAVATAQQADAHQHSGSRAHQHGRGHEHDHGEHSHSHAVPGFDGRPVTWRSLLSLGIYGGLIPCPTAIVVLLTSISLNRVGFGLVLVVAFSLGLAAVLTGIGLLLVHAGRALSRFSEGKVSSRVAQVLPLASAAAVIFAGVLITLRAVGQNGLPLV